jgi:hypothetical protein
MLTFEQMLSTQSTNPNNLFYLLMQYRVIVPGIQRHYVQGEDTPKAREVRKNFIRDIFAAFSDKKQMHLDFIYGPIRTEGTDAFIPVDGQQRLTTLWLLARYFAEFLDEESRKTCLKILRKFSYEGRLHAKRFCMALTDPQNKLFGDDEGKLPFKTWFNPYWKSDSTVAAMLGMLRTISEESKLKDLGRESAKEFLGYIAEKISFDLVTEQFADDIYMKMNARGMPVTRWETFKGKFASALEGKLQSNWQKRIEELSDLFFSTMGETEADLPDTPFLALLGRIIHYLICKEGKEKPTDELKKLASANINADLPFVPIADFHLEKLEKTAEKISEAFLSMVSYLLGKAKECKYPYWSENEDSKLIKAVFYPTNDNERDLGLILFAYFRENINTEIDIDNFKLALRLICNILTNVTREEFNRVNDIKKYFFKNGPSLYGATTDCESDKARALQYLEEEVKGKIYCENQDLIPIMQETEVFMQGRIRLGILDIQKKEPQICLERLKVIKELHEQWKCPEKRKNLVLMIVAAEQHGLLDVIKISTKDDNLLTMLTTRDDVTLQSTLIDFLKDKDITGCSPYKILEENLKNNPVELKFYDRDWRDSILRMDETDNDYDIFSQNLPVTWHKDTNRLYLYRTSDIRRAIPISDYRWELWLPRMRGKFIALANEFKSLGINDGGTQSGWPRPYAKEEICIQIFFYLDQVKLRIVYYNKGTQRGYDLRRYEIPIAEKLTLIEYINEKPQQFEIPNSCVSPDMLLGNILDIVEEICDVMPETNSELKDTSLPYLVANSDKQFEYINHLVPACN